MNIKYLTEQCYSFVLVCDGSPSDLTQGYSLRLSLSFCLSHFIAREIGREGEGEGKKEKEEKKKWGRLKALILRWFPEMGLYNTRVCNTLLCSKEIYCLTTAKKS